MCSCVRDRTRLRKMCVRQSTVYTPRRVHDTRYCTRNLMKLSRSRFPDALRKKKTCASHQFKSEPVDRLLHNILITKVELANRCFRSLAIQCIHLLDDLVLVTTMLVLWMNMTRAVTMLTMLTTNSCFAISSQLSAARRWVCVEFFHVLV